MNRSTSRAVQDETARVGAAAEGAVGMRQIFVAHQQVGLLHRLRPVARASTSLVLVRMDSGAHPCPDVQVGLTYAPTAPRLDQVYWLAGLSALDVSSLLTWLAAESGPTQDLPANLSRRCVFTPRLVP